jgi:hypothetical protein
MNSALDPKQLSLGGFREEALRGGMSITGEGLRGHGHLGVEAIRETS